MIQIRPLLQLDPTDAQRLIFGYTSDEKYAVQRVVRGDGWTFTLNRVRLPQPYVKRYDHVNAETISEFQRLVALGYSFGAYDSDHCVGLAIARREDWNKNYRVHELHAAQTHLRRGIGRGLVEALAANGRATGLRTLLCETQTTNVPAIDFYLQTGFQLEGLDLSLYRNTDYPDGEIMLSMKKPLGP
ncbi:MAG: GNAT family N-acetyltransferase [Opitutaceae bacterium]